MTKGRATLPFEVMARKDGLMLAAARQAVPFRTIFIILGVMPFRDYPEVLGGHEI
jgi:hypothetical protein